VSRLLLGAIADDFTGATDLANNLVRQGMRVIQTIGLPDPLRARCGRWAPGSSTSRSAPPSTRRPPATLARWPRRCGR